MPRVSVRNSVRKPIRPRAGTRYSIRTQPVEWLTICSSRPLRAGQHLGDGADVLLGHVDRQPLDRLVHLAFDLAGDDARLAGGQLEALAPHHLQQHDQLQLAAALDLPGVGPLGVVDPDRDVADQLGVEPVADLAGGQLVCPPVPASGEVLIPTTIESEGSSTVITGSGRGSSGSARVSPIVTSSIPATAMISPGPASAALTRSSPSVT